jgi:hypothetical protein
MTKLIPHFRHKQTEMSIRPGLISGSTLVSEFEGKMHKNTTLGAKLPIFCPPDKWRVNLERKMGNFLMVGVDVFEEDGREKILVVWLLFTDEYF